MFVSTKQQAHHFGAYATDFDTGNADVLYGATFD